MIDAATLKKIFTEKLNATGSLDQAFLKAVWVAYMQGIKDATHKSLPEDCNQANRQ